MAVNVKLAMLISFGLITATCWVVHRVARPASPIPGIAESLAATPTPAAVVPASPLAARVTERFRHSSPIDAALAARRDDPDEPAAREPAAVRPGLPPLHVPTEPSTPAVAADPTLRRPPTLAAESAAPAKAPESMVVAQAAHPVGADESLQNPQTSQTAAASESGAAAAAARTHRVARGETLTAVARRFYGSGDPARVAALLDANPRVKKRGGKVLADEVIHVPPLPESASPTRASASAAGAVREPAPAGGKASFAAAKSTPGRTISRGDSARASATYKIRRGDSLSAIAERVLKDRGRWREIAELNGIRNADRLIAGAEIRLPGDADRDA